MNADAIREMLGREPFQPFAIHLSSGETHDVRHPECLIVGANRAVVYYPNDDRFVFCALLHINAVEALQAT
jgi:hypothetical protein